MSTSQAACESCPVHNPAGLKRLGVKVDNVDFVVALAGNPNTGKSTVFNALTGLRQHTGNWPGKTVTRAEGGFAFADSRYKLVDLPGTYSLLAFSQDEQVARDFLLFGRPDVTVIVVDANRLERNLNLVLQILEITDRAVVCLNLIDEAERHGLTVDTRGLARDLGVPVVATSARYARGLAELNRTVHEVATGTTVCKPRRVRNRPPEVQQSVDRLSAMLAEALPGLPNSTWIALRLLDGDTSVVDALRSGELAQLLPEGNRAAAGERVDEILKTTSELRWQVGPNFHQALAESLYAEAARIADLTVTRSGERPRMDWSRRVDRIVTSRTWGFPLMLAMLAVVFWLTIAGANVPSGMLADLLIGQGHPFLKSLSATIGLPGWLDGLLLDGIYLATAWVISVMLPPMAIFFPLFTLLEDFGYLPRVAFNLDHLFKRAGGHGKQALTMAMGFGCNAAGVVATRIIESPRERLIAIITNNFALCNGRWPTQILIASLFIGALAPPYLAGLVSAFAVVGIALLGVLLTFFTSWLLSRTILRGEVSTFSLELPPYRPPRLLQTLYTSLIDRTIFVLWRAVIFAIPAGAAIWLLSNVNVGGSSLAEWMIGGLDPLGVAVGLSGIILLAYVIAIPANEIVVPTLLMLVVLATKMTGVGEGAGVMFEPDDDGVTSGLLQAAGFNLLMAVNLMLFSLVHNPCSTTIYTIWKETGSAKWTTVSALLPVGMGFALCFVVAQLWRLVA